MDNHIRRENAVEQRLGRVGHLISHRVDMHVFFLLVGVGQIDNVFVAGKPFGNDVKLRGAVQVFKGGILRGLANIRAYHGPIASCFRNAMIIPEKRHFVKSFVRTSPVPAAARPGGRPPQREHNLLQTGQIMTLTGQSLCDTIFIDYGES